MRQTVVKACKVPVLTLVVAGLCSGAAMALSADSAPNPPPPAGFDSVQFIDAAGCAWLKADGTWVPRVGLDRVPLCGYPPTVVALPDPEPAPMPKVAAMPAASSALVAKPPAALQAASPAAAMATGIYVQVGAYAREKNVATASQTLQTLGFSVGRTTARVKGQTLQVVLAGPFATRAEAKAARRKLCAAGFTDAYIR